MLYLVSLSFVFYVKSQERSVLLWEQSVHMNSRFTSVPRRRQVHVKMEIKGSILRSRLYQHVNTN